MATAAGGGSAYVRDQAFFVKLATGIALFIVFGFAQWGLRGMVDYAAVPVWVHLHGLAMLGWLALFVVQSRLAARGNLALHRRLGWLAAYLVVVIVVLGCAVGRMAIARHAVPPFYSNSYFLALTHIEAVAFGGLVFAAITRRKQTDFHRRLMIGAAVLVTEPAFGRVLPMPFMPGWGSWVIMALQLAILGVMARHDRRTLGRIHPATASAAGVIVLVHVLIWAASLNPWVNGVAERIAGG